MVVSSHLLLMKMFTQLNTIMNDPISTCDRKTKSDLDTLRSQNFHDRFSVASLLYTCASMPEGQSGISICSGVTT